jgi:REP element-mobilizing transposase RayT
MPIFFPDLSDVRIRTRGYVPHWERPGATYFVTYRLADSLPRHVLAQLLEHHASDPDDAFAMRLDQELDRAHGDAHLSDPRIAELIVDNWRYFDGERYKLIAFCVMPNHVHIVFRARTKLDAIVHSWKSYTAQKANQVLERTGPFWCREYFDHLVRSDEELNRIVAYVVGNPAKAGLEPWPWVWSAGDDGVED